MTTRLLLTALAAIVCLASCSKQPASTAATPSTATGAPAAPVKVEYFHVDPATAGTVTGKVTFTGKAKPEWHKKVDMDEDPLCAKLHKTAVFDDAVALSHGAVGNVFVYIKSGLDGKKFEPPAEAVTIDQKGCWFGPRVIGVQVGQPMQATNSDPVTHNIHPKPKENREWNQNQPQGAEPAVRKYQVPEIMIRVKCNIHAWMRAWIGVVDHPYFAVTGPDGSFRLKNVPPGVYTIEAWQEELGTLDQQVTVADSGKATASFTFKGE